LVVIFIDPKYYRPLVRRGGTEVDLLIGNPSKSKKDLKWEAETELKELVKIMTQADFTKISNIIE